MRKRSPARSKNDYKSDEIDAKQCNVIESNRQGQKETNAMRREEQWAVAILISMADSQALTP